MFRHPFLPILCDRPTRYYLYSNFLSILIFSILSKFSLNSLFLINYIYNILRPSVLYLFSICSRLSLLIIFVYLFLRLFPSPLLSIRSHPPHQSVFRPTTPSFPLLRPFCSFSFIPSRLSSSIPPSLFSSNPFLSFLYMQNLFTPHYAIFLPCHSLPTDTPIQASSTFLLTTNKPASFCAAHLPLTYRYTLLRNTP